MGFGTKKSLGLALALLFCVSCSTPVPPTPQTADASGNTRAPFELSVLEDVNDGAHVFVRAKLSSQIDWPLSQIALRATALREGEEKFSEILALEKVLNQSGSLTAGEEREFTLTLPADGVSDYQLELVWGEAARGINKSSQPLLKVQNISTLRHVQECGQAACPQTLTVKAALFNAGEAEIQSAKLGIGLIWLPEGAELDLSAQIPQDEEFVELSDMHLAPGARREVAIDIDQTLPARAGGRFEALLRVVPGQS
ncbi:MAG: hypothetical protein K1X79_04665 [Oligoflexia bacterium]|nr:hypothetical protein [Oligoflexia bacterium]